MTWIKRKNIKYDNYNNTFFAENLALHGTAKQQSTLTDSLGPHTANLAIEGPANNDWNDGCSSTEPNQAYVWWGLTLPQVAFITNVVIYYRGDSKYSRWF